LNVQKITYVLLIGFKISHAFTFSLCVEKGKV
jgi:hypothetical protein